MSRPTVTPGTGGGVQRPPAGEVLLLAPAGCGKTERLARHAEVLVRSGEVGAPRQILALTFTTRARTNLSTRMRSQLGPVAAHQHVVVSTFHSFAYRLYRNHAQVIGADPLVGAPQRGWIEQLRRDMARQHGCTKELLASVLTAAKRELVSDEEVRARLAASGVPAAMAYQARLDADGRIDFDDLLRYAARLLAVPAVLELYRSRFAAVLVDEAQDLTRLQYTLVADLGRDRIVFAGDPTQGIFRFAGAEPDWVFDQIRARGPAVVQLDQSHRSSPAVLRVVSALAVALGGAPIESADPARWSGRGRVDVLRIPNVQAEATAVLNLVHGWLSQDPMPSIGVMARTAARRAFVDAAVRSAGIPAEVWDDPVATARVVELLRAHASAAIAAASTDAERIEDLLRRCHAALDPDDLDIRDDVIAACEALHERTASVPLAQAIAGIRVAGAPDQPAAPGLHMLNGHVGKGQQFTKVIIVGMEEAFIPHYAAMKSGDPAEIHDELAVLHVMASRAEEDLVVTVADTVPNRAGTAWPREPSRWLDLIQDAADTDPALALAERPAAWSTT